MTYPEDVADVVRRLTLTDGAHNAPGAPFEWLGRKPPTQAENARNGRWRALAKCATPPMTDGYTEARRALGLGDPPPEVAAAASARHLKAGAFMFLNVARQARDAAAAIRQLTEQDQLETGKQ